MSKVEEITTALQDFSTEELQIIEHALISIYRQRRTGIIFDDAYGVWTEQNQTAVARGLQEGLDSLERGEGKTIDEVEKLMSSWIKK